MNMKNFTIFLSFFLVGCGGGASTQEVNSVLFDSNASIQSNGEWYKPPLDVSWQIQLKKELNQSIEAELYEVDLFDTEVTTIDSLHKDGKKVICYFNSGAYEEWREDKESFPSEVLGNDMSGWKGERWLDISNEALAPVMRARLDVAKNKGCDGVDPDNLNGYTHDTGFDLDYNKQLGYNKFIANEARKRGMAVALKNDLLQINDLVGYFDFAINEQCHTYDECHLLIPFIDAKKPVLNIEYDNAYVADPLTLCKESEAIGLNTLILPHSLDGSWRISCN